MATICRRGASWVLNWSDSAGQHRKSLGRVTQAEAQAQLDALTQRLAGQVPAAGPAFSDWARQYADWHSREYPSSYFRVEQILRTHLIPAFGDRPLMCLGREELERYKHRRLEDGASPGTVTKELRTLQAALNHAERWDVIPRNPAHGVRPPKDLTSRPPRWYTRDELGALYAQELHVHPSTTVADRDAHRGYRWTWQLLANTGLRRGEALHLRWSDVGREELRVISDPQARTKSGCWRVVPLSSGATMALDELRQDSQLVLPRIRPESLSRAFDRTAERARVGGSIHCLRHTYCSHLVQAGVPLRTVQVLAGHASYRTTERYAHLAPGHLQDAARALHL